MSARNVETYRKAHELFNTRDFDALVSLMAEDFVYHDNARTAEFRGRDGFKQFLNGWVTAFSNGRVTEARYTDAGNVVVAEFIGRGTQDGPMGPLAPKRGELALKFCEIMRFDSEGRIISGGIYYDQMTMLAQLGHAPSAGAAG